MRFGGLVILPGASLFAFLFVEEPDIMNEVYDRLHVGGDTVCRTGGDGWAVVHACKDPCHRGAIGYTGSLPQSHPQYLSLEEGEDLYLNMIDPEQPLFMKEMFEDFFAFAAAQWEDGKELLIHCNQGRSRSPSLALLFLAGHVGAITDDSFADAWAEFEALYPRYRPSQGIQIYLQRNWDEVLRLAPSS